MDCFGVRFDKVVIDSPQGYHTSLASLLGAFADLNSQDLAANISMEGLVVRSHS